MNDDGIKVYLAVPFAETTDLVDHVHNRSGVTSTPMRQEGKQIMVRPETAQDQQNEVLENATPKGNKRLLMTLLARNQVRNPSPDSSNNNALEAWHQEQDRQHRVATTNEVAAPPPTPDRTAGEPV